MTRPLRTVAQWRRQRAEDGLDGRSIGFVPTLGALHEGHDSLLRRSLAENDVTVLSIFLNPTQFDDPGDLEGYPGTLAADLARAAELGVDYVLCPTPDEMYPRGYHYRLTEGDLSLRLCGAARPGHFDGVLTIVLKLLLAVAPSRAYFGEKDHQQLDLVRGMVDDFFLDVEIVPCPTVRQADGLAVSSRNELLSEAGRRLAPHFPRLLASELAPGDVHRRLEELGFEVDYVEEHAGRRYGAVRLGEVRLIDNVALEAAANGGATEPLEAIA